MGWTRLWNFQHASRHQPCLLLNSARPAHLIGFVRVAGVGAGWVDRSGNKVGYEILHTRGFGLISVFNVSILLSLEPIVKAMPVTFRVLLMPFMGQPTERSKKQYPTSLDSRSTIAVTTYVLKFDTQGSLYVFLE